MKSDGLDKFFLWTLASFMGVAVIAFLLMRMGVFSARAVGIPLILFLGGFVSYRLVRKNESVYENGIGSLSKYVPSARNIFLLVVLLSLGLLYGIYPTYYLLGGRDPGLYLLFSVHIAKTGGLVLDLPILRELHEAYGAGIHLGFPGIYSAYQLGLSDDPAVLVPQFMHLFPSIGAIFYQLVGLEGLVRTNAVIAVLALWSFFMVIRRLSGQNSALLATMALGLNAAFIWNARITLTEALSIFFLFSGLYLLIRAFDLRSALWAAASGAVLGLALLNRIDSALNVLIILGASGVALLRLSDFRPIVLTLMATYFAFSTWAFLDGYFYSFPYFYDLWVRGSLKGLIYLNYGVLIFTFVSFMLCKQWPVKGLDLNFLMKVLLRLTTVLLAMWVLFAFFLWPIFDASFNARSINELAWYVTPVIFLVFIYGMWRSIDVCEQIPIVVPLFVISVFVLFVFTWRPSITPDHIWASRRWVPHVIPLLILFATFGLRTFVVLDSHRFIKMVTVSLLVTFYFYSTLLLASPFLSHSVMADSRKGYQSVLESLTTVDNSNDVLLSKNSQLASIMTYVFGVKTVLISDHGQNLLNNGDFNQFLAIGFDDFSKGEIIQRGRIEGMYLKKTSGDKPQSMYLRSYNGNLSRINTNSPFRTKIISTGQHFETQVGIFDTNTEAVHTSGVEGFLLFGPYIGVEPGIYRVTWKGDWAEFLTQASSVGYVDVTHGRGSVVLARRSLKKAALSDGVVGEIEFVLTETVSDLEYRYYVEKDIDLKITEIVLERIGELAP